MYLNDFVGQGGLQNTLQWLIYSTTETRQYKEDKAYAIKI